MKLIGLTGGIGSGKSAAAARLEQRGVPVIDADRIGHEVLMAGGAAEGAVRELFGEEVCSGGCIDRAKLAARVFADADALARLNQVTHPAIAAEVARRVGALEAQGHEIVVEAALLAEGGRREPWLDALILVTAPAPLRLDRLVRERGMSEEEAVRRMQAQSDPAGKVALADWVLENGTSLESLHLKVDALVEVIHGKFG